jgi:alkanesulfonate monooxygenase SsuD/methylene tetrahydromethanopterin reductase-like flavin-dependent oxidoreductase (luciferase family)
LLKSAVPVTFRGDFYTVENLKLQPPLPPELAPGIFISSSSEAGLSAAHAIADDAWTTAHLRFPEDRKGDSHISWQ